MSCLIIVDVQNDGFIVPNGKEIIPIINGLRSVKWDLVVLTQDYHPKDHMSFASNHGKKPLSVVELEGVEQILWPDHCVQGTKGVEIYSGLERKQDTDIIIRKGMNKLYDSYSAFMDNARKNKTELETVLKNNRIKRIFVCGVCHEWCVGHTACDGIQFGFETYLVEDACKGWDEKDIQRMNEKMKNLGVKFITSKEVEVNLKI